MKCPFRKRIVYTAGCSSGAGYPSEWITSEEFEKHIIQKLWQKPAHYVKISNIRMSKPGSFGIFYWFIIKNIKYTAINITYI